MNVEILNFYIGDIEINQNPWLCKASIQVEPGLSVWEFIY